MKPSISILIASFALAQAALSAELPQAVDMGFRFKDGKCLNDKGEEGYNQFVQGQCSDWRGADLRRFNLQNRDLSGSRFDGVDLSEANLAGADLQGVNFNNTNLTRAKLSNSVLFETTFEKANLTEAVLKEADISMSNFNEAMLMKVDFSGMTLFGSNFMKANLAESNFEGAKIEESKLQEIDFANVNLKGVSFIKSEIIMSNFESAKLDGTSFKEALLMGLSFVGADADNLIVQDSNLRQVDFSKASLKKSTFSKTGILDTQFVGANLSQSDFSGSGMITVSFEKANLRSAKIAKTDEKLKDVRFNGAMYSNRTEIPFDRNGADKIGMIYFAGSVFIMWDLKSQYLDELVNNLKNEGHEIELAPVTEYQVTTAQLETAEPAVILHMNGTTYSNQMPAETQAMLVKYVQDGGTFISSEWNAYEIDSANRQQGIKDLVLFSRVNGSRTATPKFTRVEKEKDHRIIKGLPKEFTADRSLQVNRGGLRTFSEMPAKALYTDDQGHPAVAYRNFGKGLVVGFHHAGNYNNRNCFNEKNLLKILNNAIDLAYERSRKKN